MNIGEIIQRDVDAAKALFHTVEHEFEGTARSAFHEVQVLGSALEEKIVALGRATGATLHVDAAIAAVRAALAAVGDHVTAVATPEPAPAPVPVAAAPVAAATAVPVSADAVVLPIAGEGN